MCEPKECGWQPNGDNQLEPLWYDGSAAPLKIEEMVSSHKNEGGSEEPEDERRYDCDDVDFENY